ncbi:MAG: L-threonylcarbamoyladenylate synthase [Nitrospirae bacterium]|nr:L-threonylcarbamoyladenylate synthase [Nitrospirota bacterium]
MITIRFDRETAYETVASAIEVLREGGVIAYPTETFYGLGAKFDMPAALERLYELKRRPREKAMPVIIGDRTGLGELVSRKWLDNVPDAAARLMNRFWPGPLTLLLPAKEGLSDFLTAQTGKIAVRVPAQSFALFLARTTGFPLTATSANLSGRPPAATAEEVIDSFDERLDLLIDGGPAPGGFSSTIVDAAEKRIAIVREGPVGREEIERCVAQ